MVVGRISCLLLGSSGGEEGARREGRGARSGEVRGRGARILTYAWLMVDWVGWGGLCICDVYICIWIRTVLSIFIHTCEYIDVNVILGKRVSK